MKQRNDLLLTLILAAILFPCAGAKAAASDPGVVAVVNGEAISQADFGKDWDAFLSQIKQVVKPEQMTDQWKQGQQRALLEKLVEQKLILQEAKKRGIAADPKDLAAELAELKAKFRVDAKGKKLTADEQEAAFKKDLAKQKLTQEKLEEILGNQLRAAALTNQVIKERIKLPTEDDARQLFAAIRDRMNKPKDKNSKEDDVDALARYFRTNMGERVQVQHILFLVDPKATSEQRDAAAKKAADVKAQLDKGARFIDMARKYSDDKQTAASSGEVGPVFHGDVPELEKIVFSLPVGSVSDVIPTKRGFEILRIEEKRAALEELTFGEARTYLEDQLLAAAKRQAFASFLADLKRSASIDLRGEFAKASAHAG